MPLMIRSSLSLPSGPSIASRGSVSTLAPSRRIVTLSATRAISLSLCEIRIEVMPCSRNASSRVRSAALSLSLSEAVGSSRIRSRTFFESALAISTSCCLPIPRSVTSVSGASFRPTRAKRSRVRAMASGQSITPKRDAASLPRKMFSAIDRSGTRASSWWMMMMPSASLSGMPEKRRSSPSNRMWPS